MLLMLTADTVPQSGGFSFVNLLVLLVVAALAWPLWRRLRASVSKNRRERWAREEQLEPFTEDTDPDLRRNHLNATELDTTERRATERDTPDPGHR